jgi:DNA invertase Pin-like site-specific DNA recombinase
MSPGRREASIQDQRAHVERYAAEHNYLLLREYADHGISGDATDRRVRFREMIADAESRRFQAILVWDVSRLGRYDIVEGGFWMKPLRDAGVKIVTPEYGPIDWGDFSSRVLWSVWQEGHHAFLRDLSRSIIRGKLESAKRGRCQHGPPYGYRKGRHRLVPGNAKQVRVLRWIFREFKKGTGLAALARRLNEKGIPSARGVVWTSIVIKSVLRNRTYLGETRYNCRQSGRYHRIIRGEIVEVLNGKLPMVWSTEADLVVCKGAHKPLIDRVTFDAVQKRFRKNRRRPPPCKLARNAFAGVLWCGLCGAKMKGCPRVGLRNVTYHCNARLMRGMSFCQTNVVNQGEMIDLLLATVESQLNMSTNDATCPPRKCVAAQMAECVPSETKLGSEIAALDLETARTAKRLFGAETAEVGPIQKKLRSLVRRKLIAKVKLRKALAANGEQITTTPTKSDRVDLWLSQFRDAMAAANTAHLCRLVREFVSRIEVWTTPSLRGKRLRHRLDRAVIYFDDEFGRRVVDCSGGVELPVQGSNGTPSTRFVHGLALKNPAGPTRPSLRRRAGEN